jgi:DNA invertase Pin-like site-specific DNA recombinase
MKNPITYLRVSTRRQGASGLGIDAQRATVETLCRDHGYRVIDRDALARAKSSRGLLVIAKLDRLARNVNPSHNCPRLRKWAQTPSKVRRRAEPSEAKRAPNREMTLSSP